MRVLGGGGFEVQSMPFTPAEEVFHTLEVSYQPSGNVATFKITDGTTKQSWEKTYNPGTPYLSGNKLAKSQCGWRTSDGAPGRKVLTPALSALRSICVDV